MAKTHAPQKSCNHVWGDWTIYGKRQERTCYKCGIQEVRNL
jgi:hypothetical protein